MRWGLKLVVPNESYKLLEWEWDASTPIQIAVHIWINDGSIFFVIYDKISKLASLFRYLEVVLIKSENCWSHEWLVQ